MRVEKNLNTLEQEIKALKASYEQLAAEMPMYKSEITFTTSINRIEYTSPAIDPTKWESIIALPRLSQNVACGVEPIIVTFECSGGINTFATLEIGDVDVTSGVLAMTTRRIAYSGGARWLVTVSPNVTLESSGWYSWRPTILKFVVRSAVAGNLGAKMIWQ